MDFDEWFKENQPILAEHGIELNTHRAVWNAAKVAENFSVEDTLRMTADEQNEAIAKAIREQL